MRALPGPSHARIARFARDLDDPQSHSDPVVATLRSLGDSVQIAPDPEFRDSLRRRLVAVATVAEQPGAEPTSERSGSRGALLRLRTGRAPVVAAGSLAAIVAIAGAGVAGSRSLPGDPFYSLKRSSEVVGLRLAGSPLERAELRLESATARLGEIEALLERSATALSPLMGTGVLAAGAPQAADLPERLLGTFTDMDEATLEARSLITETYAQDREPAPLELLVSWSEEQATRLDDLLPALPPVTHPVAEQSRQLVRESGQEAQALLDGVCGPQCPQGPVGGVDVVCDCPADPPAEPGQDSDEGPVTRTSGPPSAPSPASPAPAAGNGDPGAPAAGGGGSGGSPGSGGAGGSDGASGSGGAGRPGGPGPAQPPARNQGPQSERAPGPQLPMTPGAESSPPPPPRSLPPLPSGTTVPLPGPAGTQAELQP